MTVAYFHLIPNSVIVLIKSYNRSDAPFTKPRFQHFLVASQLSAGCGQLGCGQ